METVNFKSMFYNQLEVSIPLVMYKVTHDDSGLMIAEILHKVFLYHC
jgi:hypothetical protein